MFKILKNDIDTYEPGSIYKIYRYASAVQESHPYLEYIGEEAGPNQLYTIAQFNNVKDSQENYYLSYFDKLYLGTPDDRISSSDYDVYLHGYFEIYGFPHWEIG